VIAKANLIMHSNALKIGTKEGITGKAQSLLVHAQKTFGLKATNSLTIGGGSTTINVSNAEAISVSGSGAGELGGAAVEQQKDQIREKGGRGGGGGGSVGNRSGRPSPKLTTRASTRTSTVGQLASRGTGGPSDEKTPEPIQTISAPRELGLLRMFDALVEDPAS
jgi:hypothetical protein